MRHLIQLQLKPILIPKMRVQLGSLKHSLYWIQIKLFLFSNNRLEQTTKFVLHCLIAALGSRNNKISKILKRSNKLYVEKHMRLLKHLHVQYMLVNMSDLSPLPLHPSYPVSHPHHSRDRAALLGR